MDLNGHLGWKNHLRTWLHWGKPPVPPSNTPGTPRNAHSGHLPDRPWASSPEYPESATGPYITKCIPLKGPPPPALIGRKDGRTKMDGGYVEKHHPTSVVQFIDAGFDGGTERANECWDWKWPLVSLEKIRAPCPNNRLSAAFTSL